MAGITVSGAVLFARNLAGVSQQQEQEDSDAEPKVSGNEDAIVWHGMDLSPFKCCDLVAGCCAHCIMVGMCKLSSLPVGTPQVPADAPACCCSKEVCVILLLTVH